MNKNVTPKQLELTAGKTREDMEEAARAVLHSVSPAAAAALERSSPLPRCGPTAELDDDFDWNNPEEESIVLREQRATAVYRNPAGELVVRQKAGALDDRDAFVWVSPENVTEFLEATAKRARET